MYLFPYSLPKDLPFQKLPPFHDDESLPGIGTLPRDGHNQRWTLVHPDSSLPWWDMTTEHTRPITVREVPVFVGLHHP